MSNDGTAVVVHDRGLFLLNFSEVVPDILDWEEEIPKGYAYCAMEVTIIAQDEHSIDLAREKILAFAETYHVLVYDPQQGTLWNHPSSLNKMIRIGVSILFLLFALFHMYTLVIKATKTDYTMPTYEEIQRTLKGEK